MFVLFLVLAIANAKSLSFKSLKREGESVCASAAENSFTPKKYAILDEGAYLDVAKVGECVTDEDGEHFKIEAHSSTEFKVKSFQDATCTTPSTENPEICYPICTTATEGDCLKNVESIPDYVAYVQPASGDNCATLDMKYIQVFPTGCITYTKLDVVPVPEARKRAGTEVHVKYFVEGGKLKMKGYTTNECTTEVPDTTEEITGCGSCAEGEKVTCADISICSKGADPIFEPKKYAILDEGKYLDVAKVGECVTDEDGEHFKVVKHNSEQFILKSFKDAACTTPADENPEICVPICTTATEGECLRNEEEIPAYVAKVQGASGTNCATLDEKYIQVFPEGCVTYTAEEAAPEGTKKAPKDYYIKYIIKNNEIVIEGYAQAGCTGEKVEESTDVACGSCANGEKVTCKAVEPPAPQPVCTSTADNNFTPKKYAVIPDGAYVNAFKVGECIQDADNDWVKIVKHSSTQFIVEVYEEANCGGEAAKTCVDICSATKTEECAQNVDEITGYVAYVQGATGTDCATLDDKYIQIFPEGCHTYTEDDAEGTRKRAGTEVYIKYIIKENKIVIEGYAQAGCTGNKVEESTDVTCGSCAEGEKVTCKPQTYTCGSATCQKTQYCLESANKCFDNKCPEGAAAEKPQDMKCSCGDKTFNAQSGKCEAAAPAFDCSTCKDDKPVCNAEGTECIATCPETHKLVFNKKCVEKCPDNSEAAEGKTECECKTDFVVDGDKCIADPCKDKEGQIYDAKTKTCVCDEANGWEEKKVEESSGSADEQPATPKPLECVQGVNGLFIALAMALFFFF